MTPGFIGTGTITTALVTGLCTSPRPPEELWVSPRNAEKAARLASAFDSVRVAAGNQEVLDRTDGDLAAMTRECMTPGGSMSWRSKPCRRSRGSGPSGPRFRPWKGASRNSPRLSKPRWTESSFEPGASEGSPLCLA